MVGKKTIILFSGGRESLINLYTEVQYTKPKDITLLLINYGQDSFANEWASTSYYANLYDVNIRCINLDNANVPTSIRAGTPYETTNKNVDNVIARNILFLSFVVNKLYDGSSKCKILIGATYDEGKGDNTLDFLRNSRKLFSGMFPNLYIDAHSANLKINEKQTLGYLLDKEVDISHLWMCNKSGIKMCGKCRKCHLLKTYYPKKDFNKIKDKFLN